MAVLMTTMILQDKEFGQLAEKIKAVYTFGQPMIGSPDFAKRAADMKGLPSLFRYVYRGDLVPQLPPKESGDFEHFGTEFRYAPTENPPWKVNSEPTTQTDLAGIGGALVGFFSEKIKNLAGFLFPTSIVDHYPQRYITWLTPPDGPTEFGDTSVGVVPKAKAKENEKVVNPREAIAALLSIVKNRRWTPRYRRISSLGCRGWRVHKGHLRRGQGSARRPYRQVAVRAGRGQSHPTTGLARIQPLYRSASPL